MNLRTLCLMIAAYPLVTSGTARAEEGAGQSKLDQAIELKLNAESVSQLGEVIDLCKGALKEGLDADNKPFAQQLLVSTLVQRGTTYAEVVLKGTPEQIQTPRQYRQLRAMALADLGEAMRIDSDQPSAWFTIGRLESIPGGDQEAREGSLR